MNLRTLLAAFLLCFATIGAVSCDLPGSAQEAPDQAEAASLWTCGMHPQVIQDEPGSCPLCGMDLTPRGATPAAGGHDHGDGTPTSAGAPVTIDPVVVQNMGVRTQVVERQTIFRHLRTIGEVQVAEDELCVVNLRFGGWVERILVDRTGDEVRAGQRLFEIYSPELVAAQEELLLAVQGQGADSPLAVSARRRLELWDIGAGDIDAILDAGQATRTLPIRAPSNGFVLHKNVVDGARVQAGQDLYRIGDLSSIWVEAEVYEFDAPWVELGQPAQMELPFRKGTVLEGEVAYIYPTLEAKSRTLRVRLEFDNPGVALKPGMFATVHIQYRRREGALAVPTEAVIHSGERELVFVALGEGRFAAREVTTGLVADHRLTEVLDGLEVGEVVVTSGQFLLDSESQLQEAIAKLLAARAGGGEEAESDPTTLYSCPMHPEVLSAEPGRCPDCGMFLEEREGTAEELAIVHGAPAKAAYFCPMCEGVESERPGKCPECGMFLEASEGGPYTCPMHPEVVSERPGRCPECKMFLEGAKGDEHEHQEH